MIDLPTPTDAEVLAAAHGLVGSEEQWHRLDRVQQFNVRELALKTITVARSETTKSVLDWLLARFEENPSPLIDLAIDAVKFERFRLDEGSSDD